MSSSEKVTAIIAIVGLLTTFFSPAIAAYATNRTNRKAEQRQLKIQLLIDLAYHVEQISKTIEAIADDLQEYTPDRPPELAHQITLDARVNLLAPYYIRRAWKRLQMAEANVLEDYNNRVEYSQGNIPYLPTDSISLTEARSAIKDLEVQMRITIKNVEKRY